MRENVEFILWLRSHVSSVGMDKQWRKSEAWTSSGESQKTEKGVLHGLQYLYAPVPLAMEEQ